MMQSELESLTWRMWEISTSSLQTTGLHSHRYSLMSCQICMCSAAHTLLLGVHRFLSIKKLPRHVCCYGHLCTVWSTFQPHNITHIAEMHCSSGIQTQLSRRGFSVCETRLGGKLCWVRFLQSICLYLQENLIIGPCPKPRWKSKHHNTANISLQQLASEYVGAECDSVHLAWKETNSIVECLIHADFVTKTCYTGNQAFWFCSFWCSTVCGHRP